LHSKEDC
jgi:hypothetical protein